MRLTIIAGLIMGASLAFLSAFDAHARDIAAHAANNRPAHVSAPWYTATDRSANTQRTFAA